MKGIAHFAVGVAAASCLPAAVQAGADGNPLYFILGGVFGLLPDTLDFKFCRFFYRHDMEIRPDPLDIDPQMIADGIACAVNRAYETGRPVRLKLDTVQLAEDRWQSYEMEFDVVGRKVVVAVGPVVGLGDTKESHTETQRTQRQWVAKLCCGVRPEYFARTRIDIFEGPVFEFVPDVERGMVFIKFLPWHRAWTHAFIPAVLFALAGWLAWDAWAGLVILLAYSSHIVLDQLGFMGSNLMFPFTRTRTAGLMKMHSGEAVWNFAAVWLACLVIFWSLYSSAGWTIHGYTVIKHFFYGAILPWGVFRFYGIATKEHKGR